MLSVAKHLINSRSNSPPKAARHRWKIQRKAACFRDIVRGPFKRNAAGIDNAASKWSRAAQTKFVPRGLRQGSIINAAIIFPKIAAWSAFRSTPKTSESLEWRTSARPKTRPRRPEQSALVNLLCKSTTLAAYSRAQCRRSLRRTGC